MRAKVLAARLNSPSFRDWLDKELNGYREHNDVPEYRKVKPQILGDFWGMFGAKVQNVKLLTNGLDPEIRSILEVHPFLDNIGAIEEMMSADTETFHRHWDVDIVEYMRHASGTRVDHHVLQCVQSIFTKPVIRGVLQAIRSRLLDLLLQLRDEYPELEAEDAAMSSVSPEFVGQLVQKVIYNNCTVMRATAMTNNNINAGRDINVGHDFIVATSIQDSFKQIQDSEVSGDLGTALETVVKAIESIHSELEQNAAKQLAEDCKALVHEATKREPRKSIIQAVGGALKSNVETLGKVALPLTLAVEKVMELVGGAG
jgi:hypothetical protein